MDESKFEEIIDMFNGLEIAAKNDPKLDDDHKNAIVEVIKYLTTSNNCSELIKKMVVIKAVMRTLEHVIGGVVIPQNHPLDGVTVKGGKE